MRLPVDTDQRARVVLTLIALSALAVSPASSAPLPAALLDGVGLRDVEGTVTGGSGRWTFVVADPIRQGPVSTDAGWTLELLPSSTLEGLVAQAGARPQGRFRLSGRVETYRGRHYLLATSGVALAGPGKDPNALAVSLPPGEDPNLAGLTRKGDPLAIPRSVQDRLAEYQARRQRSVRSTPIVAGLRVLVDEVGLIVQGQDRAFLVTDPLGQDAMPKVFELLPCRTLESMERLQSQVPEPVRFRVAGLLTHYQGGTYMLLHRAVREHDYGNFAR